MADLGEPSGPKSMRHLRELLGLQDERLARSAARILAPALLVVGVSVSIAMAASEPGTARFFDNVYWTVAYTAGALLAWLGVRSSTPEDKRPKQWFAWALTTYAIGQLLWDAQVASGWNPFPGPSDLFYVCLGPLTGLGWVAILSRNEGRTARRTAILDSAGLSVAVLALTLALYLPKRGELALLPLSFLVAYPVALCWAASTALTAILALRLNPGRGLLLFVLGLFGNAALWLKWNLLTLDKALADGTPLNALVAVGALAQGTGALLLRSDPAPSKRWERFCEGVLRLLPLFIVVVCALAVVLAFTLPHVPAAMRWSALGGGLVVVVIATLRQSLLLGERERLIEAERELRRAEETFRVLVEQAADGIFIANGAGVYLDVNTRGAEMLGMAREEVIGERMAHVVAPEQVERIGPELDRLLRGETVHSSWTFRRKDGSLFYGEITAKQLPDGRLQGFVRDVSERLALEAQLRQSQKMEAMGVLAAGIAHDFNNVLTAIRGNAALAAQDVGVAHPAAGSIADIERAAERATELVQRILAFSRPRPPASEQVNLATLVGEVVKLLRPTLPAGIELRMSLPSSSALVSADPDQLHQVLMNLCTNAWQAMDGKPGHIELGVSLRRLYGDEPGLELVAGDYVCLAVTDTGRGMSSATQERIFEPFFTTKAPGEGTGLGLSIVHGII
ncbi:MAG TPA: PAS domain S-box protein, partial [Polyangiaceae bacterium]